MENSMVEIYNTLTFGAQTFTEMHPKDDWETYFHNFLPTLGAGVLHIALRKYGPPYEVVVGGFDNLTISIQVCVFSLNGKSMGYTTDSMAGEGYIMVECTETLRNCKNYFALANAAVVDGDAETDSITMHWSSISVYVKGESCESRAFNTIIFVSKSLQPFFTLPIRQPLFSLLK